MTQPDSIPAEWMEACALALCMAGPRGAAPRCEAACFTCREEARAAITILRPLIEAETRERCARIADENAKYSLVIVDGKRVSIARHVADAIRASALRADGNPK